MTPPIFNIRHLAQGVYWNAQVPYNKQGGQMTCTKCVPNEATAADAALVNIQYYTI